MDTITDVNKISNLFLTSFTSFKGIEMAALELAPHRLLFLSRNGCSCRVGEVSKLYVKSQGDLKIDIHLFGR